MFNVGGKGHSCGIYSFDDDHIHRLGMCAPVSRIMVRQPNNRGNSGSSTNGMPPTDVYKRQVLATARARDGESTEKRQKETSRSRRF